MRWGKGVAGKGGGGGVRGAEVISSYLKGKLMFNANLFVFLSTVSTQTLTARHLTHFRILNGRSVGDLIGHSHYQWYTLHCG